MVVVLVSGSINVDEKLEEYGTTVILPKPFDMNKVKELVNKLCIH